MKVKILITLSLALIVSSCSVFKSSRQIDMSPFSDNASTMFGEAVKISRPFQWKHLKAYTSIPEFQELVKRSIPLLSALQGIVYYSNQVVAINNSRLSNPDKPAGRKNYRFQSELVLLFSSIDLSIYLYQ